MSPASAPAFALSLAALLFPLCDGAADSPSVPVTPSGQPSLPAPTPVPPPQIDDFYRLSVKGHDCVRARFKVNLTVAYSCRGPRGGPKASRDNCRAHVRLPEPRNATVSGRCGAEPILNLGWPGSQLRLTIKFTRDSNYWFADHVEFSFNLSDPHFPNSSEAKNGVLSAEKGLKFFKTPNGWFYQCHAEEVVPLGLGSSQHASVSFRNATVQVFDVPPPPSHPSALKDFFSRDYKRCSADALSGRSQNTAFIIATCLALLVASMIAGYYFSKRSSQSPYATVD